MSSINIEDGISMRGNYFLTTCQLELTHTYITDFRELKNRDKIPISEILYNLKQAKVILDSSTIREQDNMVIFFFESYNQGMRFLARLANYVRTYNG